jgi:hypothetical protein
MRTQMIQQKIATAPGLHTLRGHVRSLRERAAGINTEKTLIRGVAAGLVIGTAALLATDTDSHRYTDTSAERVARIAPVGTVTLAAATPAAREIPAAGLVDALNTDS